MKSFGREAFNKFGICFVHVFYHKKAIPFFLMIFILLNPITNGDLIREPKLEVVVDNMHKEVSPDEDAIFYWTVYNNESFITFEVTVQCDPDTGFSESSFSLAPGEKREVIQTIHVPDFSENITNLSHIVHWNAMVNMGATSGSFTPWSGCINVTVINETKPSQSFSYEIPNPDAPSDYVPILMMVSILLIYIILLIIRKKLISQKRFRKK